MLAIITKMTLTQVSTWFANARRRLKKENKMTWEVNIINLVLKCNFNNFNLILYLVQPKNKTDDDDDDIKDEDGKFI